MKVAEFHVASEKDIRNCARRVRLLAGLADLTRRQRSDLSKAFVAVATRVLEPAGGSDVAFGFSANASWREVEVILRVANADGIPDLEPLGESVDQFRIAEPADGGLVIRLGQHLPADAVTPNDSELVEWGLVLRANSVESALLESQKRRRATSGEQIASRKRNEEIQRHLDLESSSETLNMLSLVANKTDNLVMILDTSGQAEWVNAAFVRMTGYSFAEIAGIRPIELLRCGDESRESYVEFDEAMRMGRSVNEELMLKRKDGASLWATLTLTPVTGEDGQISHWIGIGADVTRRRQAHEVLERAKETAETANRAKSEFLANMSHEIRTPMNAIIGMTDLALASDLPADLGAYLGTVRQSAGHLLKLLNEILDLSKIEAGKLEIESLPFNLSELVTSTLEPVAVTARAKGLEFNWHLPSDLPSPLLGDPNRLRQILMNLVSNAAKFTEKGSISVDVETLWESTDAVSLHFAVTDTGIGISSDRLDAIFQAFEQEDSSTTRRFGGTGLGLTICTQLVRLMGGSIWVKSELDVGSSFHFSLRLQRTTEAEHPLQRPHPEPIVASADLASDSQLPIASQLKVLVVDDHAANRDLASMILGKRGHAVEHAENGSQAVETLKDNSFDVVLMDVQMPEMDGYQATRMIREREGHADEHQPIIALTAHAMKGDQERCLAAGMDAYLAKPLSSNELITLVESLAAANTPGAQPALMTTAIENTVENEMDFTQALERLAGDKELLKRQMRFFLEDAPELVTNIRESLTSGNCQELILASHRLKGLAASYDAHQAAGLAEQIESQGAAGELNGLEPVFHDLTREIEILLGVIEDYLRS